MSLAHQPQYADEYAAKGFDLVLTGHSHGGQIIIPGFGGIFAPDLETYRPKYYKGLYVVGKTKLIVNAGIEGPKPRINNPPEICVITIN